MIPTLILAAGTSSRMRGKDKLLEQVDGVPLLERQIAMARNLGGMVFVAIAEGQTARNAIIAKAGGVALVIKAAPDGIGATLRDSVALLPPCSAFMVLLADLPALETQDLARVMKAYERSDDALIWRAATADGKPGHPIIFADTLRPAFAALDGDKGAATILSSYAQQTRIIRLADSRARLDLDTPEDWAAWRSSNG